jgi:nucleotide-binding universal stress UspA family protein
MSQVPRVRIGSILCPTDFSEPSARAFSHAVALSRWYDSEITLLHVLPRVPVLYGGFVPVEQDFPLGPEVRRIATEEMETFVRPARDAGARTQILIEEGDPVRDILRRAREQKADLLVLGTHGRSGFDRWVLGSVTEKVLRKAACPVLTVPPARDGAPTTAVFRQILCAIDFSASSARSLDFALSLAQESDARLTLLHVVDAPAVDEIRDSGFVTTSDHLASLEKRAADRLRAAVTDEVRNWCRPEEKVVSGKPWREILRVAAEAQADLIVMGVQGRHPVDLMLFGSTTHHVVREAACPVLTVRAR